MPNFFGCFLQNAYTHKDSCHCQTATSTTDWLSRVNGWQRPGSTLEDPRNLGNVGAVVRVAAAADAKAVVTTGASDPWDRGALRGSAGLHYALPVWRTDELPSSSSFLIALDPEGQDITELHLPNRGVFAFGTERDGLSEELSGRASVRVSIPMRQGVSSLNLATSVAVVLFMLRFQQNGVDENLTPNGKI